MTSTVSERARRASEAVAGNVPPLGATWEIAIMSDAELISREFPAYEEMREFMPKVLAFIVNPQAFDAEEMERQARELIKRLEAKP